MQGQYMYLSPLLSRIPAMSQSILKDSSCKMCSLLLPVTGRRTFSSQYLIKKIQSRQSDMKKRLISCYISNRGLNTFSKDRWENVERYSKLLKYGKRRYIYLFDSDIADMIVSHIKPSLDSDTCVIEAFPGPGILSSRFLDCGIRRLVGVEPRKELKESFHDFAQTTEGRVSYETMRNVNYAIFKNLRQASEEGKIVLFVSSPLTLPFFMYTKLPPALITKNFVYRYGRDIPIYCLMPRFHYEKYMVKKEGKKDTRHSVFYKVFFDLEVLAEIDRKYFDPEPNIAKCWFDDQDILLVKILPKPNVYEMFGTIEMLRGFHYFTAQLRFRPKDRLIPRIEEWAPGGGSRLIARGYNMMDLVTVLTADELVALYRDFVTWPELKDSTFVAGLEHVMDSEHGSLSLQNEQETLVTDGENVENDDFHDVYFTGKQFIR